MPTFSEIEITFIEDFELNYNATLSTKITNSEAVTQIWTWVSSRSSAFQVTKGTPTGTPGERTAINFKAAFDLDNATGYVTTILSNVVTIASETATQTFIGFRATTGTVYLTNGIQFSVLFDNYIAPSTVTSLNSVLVRSPHYVFTPFYFSTTTKMDLAIKVFSGDFGTPPATSTFDLTKIRPTTDYTQFNTNISDLISSKLTNDITIDLSAVSQVVPCGSTEYLWVNYTASYTDPFEVVAPVVGLFGTSSGYGEYSQGVNPTLPNGFLSPCVRRKILRDGIIILPFKNNEYYSQVVITAGSDHTNTITLTASDLSTDFVQYVQINMATLTTAKTVTVEFTKTAGGTETVTYDIIDECVNIPKTILYINRYGFYDTLVMFGKNAESLSVKRETFVNNYVSNGAYSIEKHQIKNIDTIGNKSIKCFSGYIREVENELYEDLLLSEKVYFHAGSETVTPINVKSQNFPFKTRINDTQVIYEIDFNYAFNHIQNV